MNTKITEYRVKPEKSSERTPNTFNIVFKIVEQVEIPSKIKLKKLFPSYILEQNLEKSRKRFVNSFFFPVSKEKWRTLYNMNSVNFGRNFYKGTAQVGVKSVAIRDRRYKKGYRTELHSEWGKVPKHHLFLPWTELSNQTKDALRKEFNRIMGKAIRNHKIGRIVVPFLLIIITVLAGSQNGLLGLIGIIMFFVVIGKYIVNKKKIEEESLALSREIEDAFLNQDEYLTRRFLPYSEISYVELEDNNIISRVSSE